MKSVLLDTSILGRLANESDPFHEVTTKAIERLIDIHVGMYITPQNLIEFRAFATRPTSVNGLGLNALESALKSDVFEDTYSLLPDNDKVYPRWKSIVTRYSVLGKQVHDARLVAVCLVHGVYDVMTYNTKHFTRFESEGIQILDPSQV